MNYVVYCDKTHQLFPTVSASASNPQTLYQASTDLVFVNTGSGWQPAVQPSTNTVYSAVSTASATVKAAVVASISNTSSAPTPVHNAVATKAVNVVINGH